MKGETGSKGSAVLWKKHHGYSMAEVITVIAVIGVLAGIVLPTIGGSLSPSKTAIARNLVETVNNAVHRFNQTNYELLFTAVSVSGQDEMLILRTIQYRNPTNPAPGSPYMRNDWNPAISSNTADHRLVWTGTLYKLVEPGQTGTGLKVNFEGGDLGTPFVFPPGFTMAGK